MEKNKGVTNTLVGIGMDVTVKSAKKIMAWAKVAPVKVERSFQNLDLF